MHTQFATEKHVKYLKRHLGLLPSSQQSHDVNKMAIIFYSLVSLSAIGIDVAKEYGSSAQWICRHRIALESSGSKVALSGFVGSLTLDIPNTNTVSLPNTLFALLVLRLLKCDEFFCSVRNRETICAFVSTCQVAEDGSFTSVLANKHFLPSPLDASDLRFCFIAVEILCLLGCRKLQDYSKYINVDKLIAYILSQQCDSGGFGSYGEPHAGYTSCALSTLSLLESLACLTDEFKELTLLWLVHRQVSDEGCMQLQCKNPFFDEEDHGGFQGRENKFADTCYAFWCLNSMNILQFNTSATLGTFESAKMYLLSRTQNTIIGGFSKNDVDDPDLYHTCLGVAALKLIEGTFNGVLFLPSAIDVSS
ncbi:hypothetical protein HG535_0D01770 [Zygotorulaspora mrakii]|uniref:Prenyltransferase alpha-alpha toroid domain-containing protein n=1 Tax=Zygotorulaspora mrakii TaxID=42260 RepID=A0A7H9B3E3_ZYGMR|nr:uncharacterized protein HG535_0D01770 [Zygotorulaspora mrakii]QLG72469.1 hypothetical protein HG535_0D01770 [Zygotorulaspora mrakii]